MTQGAKSKHSLPRALSDDLVLAPMPTKDELEEVLFKRHKANYCLNHE
jgi:hypothetical protein